MDTSKLNDLSKGQKIAGGAGVVSLIAAFLPWYTWDVGFGVGGGSLSGTDFMFGWMGMVCLVAAAGLVVAPAFGKEIGTAQLKGEQIAIGLAGIGGLMWLFRLVRVPGGFNSFGRGFGLFVAVAAAAAVIAGIVMTMKEKGIEMPNASNFSSLKDGVSTTTTPVAPHAEPAPAPASVQPSAPIAQPAPAPVQPAPPVQHSAPIAQPAPAPTPQQQGGAVQF